MSTLQPIPHVPMLQGQLDRVLDTLRIMRDDQVRPDAETFSLAFQCLGRQQRSAESVRVARRLLRDMDEAVRPGLGIR